MLRTLLSMLLVLHYGSAKDIPQDFVSLNVPDGPDRWTQDTEQVAFSAELSSDTELVGDSTIVYDRVIANAGQQYFSNSGQFVCADDRVHVFVWSLMKVPALDLEGMRCINKLRNGGNDHKFGPKSDYFDTTVSGVAEMTTVLQCTTSPLTAVTVVTVPWSGEAGKTSFYRAKYTSFSGFRLSQDVAFTAELSEDQYLFPGSRIRFDRVLWNFGGHYDNSNYSFRCPDDGVYVFSVSTYTRDPATPWSVSRLMKGREMVLQGPITYWATDDYDSGSASVTAVLQCTQGYSIYVEAQATYNFSHNSYGPELTSFTGFKLYDIVEGAVAFTAIMSNNHTTQYDKQPFIFDQIITNVGNAFDTNHSEFVCPDDDYYLFTWSTVANYGGDESNTDLYMDDTVMKWNYVTEQSDSDITGTSGSSSVSVIKQCMISSRFYVVGRLAQERVYLGEYTSFSGYKIPY